MTKKKFWGWLVIFCLIISNFYFPQSPVQAATAFVQGNAANSFGSSSVGVSLPSSVNFGNILAAGVLWFSTTVNLNSVTAPCVSGGFTLVNNPTANGSTSRAAMAYGVVTSSGSCTITANFSSAMGASILVHEISGVDTSSPLDGSAMLHQDVPTTSAGAVTSGNITTTQNGDYIFGVVADAGSNSGTYATAGGMTSRVTLAGWFTSADRVQSSAGSVSANFTSSLGYDHPTTGIMAFRPSGGGSPTPTPTPTATPTPTPTPTVTPTPTPIPTPTPTPIQTNQLLDPSRSIDWTNVGLPGGIPSRTTVCANISAATYGNGSSDATSGIQAALNSCGTYQVVLLGAGTFRVNSSLTIPSNVTLRGQGANQTIIKFYGTGNAINFGSGAEPPYTTQTVNLTGGGAKGSTSITVSSAANISVGKYLTLNQLNDTYVTNVGEGGQTCTWCDVYWNGTRLEGQIVEVTSVSGNTIGIFPGLYRDYTRSPQVTPWTAGAKYAGLEDLQVYANNTGYTAMENMNATAYCWIKGVMNNFADGDHVRATNSFRGEIRDSYFTDAFNHGPGSTDADIFLAMKTSGFLVENNILERLHSSILFNWGASGNVVAYNYTFGAYGDNLPNFSTSDIAMHGAHPSYNLLEGNISSNFTADGTWGSNSHNTLFRNWWKGTTKVATPYSTRGVVNWGSAGWGVQHVRGVELAFASRYFNLIGNVVGSSDTAALKAYNIGSNLSQVSMVVAPTNRSYDSAAYGYTFGYSGATDPGTAPEDNALAYTTAFIHGDYEYTRNSVAWDANNSVRNLPASLYRSSKPSWFGSLAWPAIGPDISGGQVGARGYAQTTPALNCYNNSQKDSNGYLIFNASTCYTSGGPAPTPTPTPISTPVPGDLNLDHIINSLDFSLLNSRWNQNYPSYDLLIDNIINTFDYAILKSNWGRTW